MKRSKELLDGCDIVHVIYGQGAKKDLQDVTVESLR